MKSAFGILLIGSGAMLVYTGFKDKSVWQELLAVVRG
jgi:hypothetical protein